MTEGDDERDRSDGESEPLLHHPRAGGGEGGDGRALLTFKKDDGENPRSWPYSRKMMNVLVIAMMSLLSPLASSMFTPGIEQIAESLSTSSETVIGCTTGFVIMLGIGPLFLAPLSETFGRRKLYLTCFTMFAVLHVPSALSPNIQTLIAMRTLSGFFGSVGIANGGGTISDMFPPSQRAGIFGWYLLGPLLGPTLGPLFGGFIVQRMGWRWIFWALTVVCGVNTLAGFFLLEESYAPVLLSRRKRKLEGESGTFGKYRFEGEDVRPLTRKILHSLKRPIRILLQPIVFTMSTYQAILFGTTYSIYTNMQPIYQGEYGFNTEQVGLLYLGPGLGFLFAVWFLVPRIDTVYNALSKRHDGKERPEFRLPLANIGAVFIPAALFWFAWTVQYHAHWVASIVSTFFYGIGQVMVLNCTQNYYIDSFEKYSASAIAGGAVFRSLVGGVVPLFAPTIFDKLGYGWGVSMFGFFALIIAPAPSVFYYYGQWLRENFRLDL
ncbi:hypothetical protein M433DRAFT_85249 [Acidomyces richmondensis BFW]|nr:MAG: hypothetical protein FE78DRAFT_179695 [Acidomyces sp. 'richmondensis']KYG47678.1 hypothetical protein M433DRAFT_85249 [Acidomyces richmondensis BFW]